MDYPQRILLVEDSRDDVELVTAALDAFHLTDRIDVVGDGAAVRAARLCHPDVPVILISGVIGEDLAAETLTIGASDFVLKDRLERLVPVIQRWAPQSDATRQNG
jgi:DNA-binding NtrC family response regulator